MYDGHPTFSLLGTNFRVNCSYEEVGECMVGNEGDVRSRMITTPGDISHPQVTFIDHMLHAKPGELPTSSPHSPGPRQVSMSFPFTDEETNLGDSPQSFWACGYHSMPNCTMQYKQDCYKMAQVLILSPAHGLLASLGSSLETGGKSFEILEH